MLARRNVSYSVRLRTANGKRVGFYNNPWATQITAGIYATDARWSNVPIAAVLFEKESEARHFREEILNSHMKRIQWVTNHLKEQYDWLLQNRPADEQEAEYLAQAEKELAAAIDFVPFIRDAEIVRIVVETM